MTLLRSCALATAAAAVLAGQEGPKGPRPTQMPNQERERGRVGSGSPSAVRSWSGMMVDASCRDRSSLNLHQPPVVKTEAEAAQPAAKDSGAAPANEAPAHAETGDRERQNALAQLTPDALARQQDMTCALTAGTSNFAVLLDDGRLFNLDQGGNTLVAQSLQSISAGRSMLSGAGPAIKPRVKLRGRLRGDELIVERIEQLQ